MNIEVFGNRLKKALQKGLPGEKAQIKMGAKRLSGQPYYKRTPANPKCGAVLISFFVREQQIFFTLMKRPSDKGAHRGQIGIPGGKREQGETPIQNALRESNEEIGTDLSALTVIGELTPLYIVVSDFLVYPIVGILKKEPQYRLQKEEVDYILEIPLHDFLDEKNIKEKKLNPMPGVELIAPYFDLENETVWGATAMILNELRTILLNEKIYE